MMLARIESSLRTGAGADTALATCAGGGVGVLAAAAGATGGVATGVDAASVTGATVGDKAGGVETGGCFTVSGIRVAVSTGGVVDEAGGVAATTTGRPGVFDDASTTGPDADGDTDLAATGGAGLLETRVSASIGGRVWLGTGVRTAAIAFGADACGTVVAGRDPATGAGVMLCRDVSGTRVGVWAAAILTGCSTVSALAT
jgi:hypothetical protein